MRGMRRFPLVLLACSLVFVAGCGDDDDEAADGGGEALSTEEFIEQGDAICKDFSDRAAELTAPEDEADQARYLGELIAIGEDVLSDFQAIEPPSDGEEVHAALVGALEKGLDTLGGAQDAAESGDTVTAGDLMAQATAESDAADEEAKEYGFEVCGSGD